MADTIPVWLEKGEHVINNQAADLLGRQNLVNANKMGAAMRYANTNNNGGLPRLDYGYDTGNGIPGNNSQVPGVVRRGNSYSRSVGFQQNPQYLNQRVPQFDELPAPGYADNRMKPSAYSGQVNMGGIQRVGNRYSKIPGQLPRVYSGDVSAAPTYNTGYAMPMQGFMDGTLDESGVQMPGFMERIRGMMNAGNAPEPQPQAPQAPGSDAPTLEEARRNYELSNGLPPMEQREFGTKNVKGEGFTVRDNYPGSIPPEKSLATLPKPAEIKYGSPVQDNVRMPGNPNQFGYQGVPSNKQMVPAGPDTIPPGNRMAASPQPTNTTNPITGESYDPKPRQRGSAFASPEAEAYKNRPAYESMGEPEGKPGGLGDKLARGANALMALPAAFEASAQASDLLMQPGSKMANFGPAQALLRTDQNNPIRQLVSGNEAEASPVDLGGKTTADLPKPGANAQATQLPEQNVQPQKPPVSDAGLPYQAGGKDFISFTNPDGSGQGTINAPGIADKMKDGKGSLSVMKLESPFGPNGEGRPQLPDPRQALMQAAMTVADPTTQGVGDFINSRNRQRIAQDLLGVEQGQQKINEEIRQNKASDLTANATARYAGEQAAEKNKLQREINLPKIQQGQMLEALTWMEQNGQQNTPYYQFLQNWLQTMNKTPQNDLGAALAQVQ